MKALACFLLFVSVSSMLVTATAQNKKYLLLEYVKVKPGIDTSPVIKNTRQRLQAQNKKDHSVLQSTMWESVNPARNKGEYQYIVATVFKNFNDYLSEYKNSDSKVFYSLSKDRLDSVVSKKSDSFDIVYTPIFEILAEVGEPEQPPQFVLTKNIKATSGKGMAYESLELTDWLPIHQDLIKKGYETAYNFNKLIFPAGSPYDYCTLLFFHDEGTFEKQNDIDYQPYMQANQGAFINSGRLRIELRSELLRLVTVLETGE